MPMTLTVYAGNNAAVGGTLGGVDNAIVRQNGTGQVLQSSAASVNDDGDLVTGQYRGIVFPNADASTNVTLVTGWPNQLAVKFGTQTAARFGSGTNEAGGYTSGLMLQAGTVLSWAASIFSQQSGDLILARDAPNVLGQRNTTNPQTERIYNTYTSATSGEWFETSWVSNVCYIGTNKGSVGGSVRDLAIEVGGTVVANFLSNAFYLGPRADNTVTGGNARGANAVDFQTLRNAASQVASGLASFVFPSLQCTASGNYSAAGGAASLCSGSRSFVYSSASIVSGTFSANVGGNTNTVSGDNAFVGGGFRCIVSGAYGQAMGADATSDRYCQYTQAPFRWHGGYNRHGYVRMVGGGRTTDAAPTALTLDNVSAKVTIGSGSVCALTAHVLGVKSDGSAVAEYRRRVRIKNVGGTTSLVGSNETIGSDYEDNAATDLSITANDTTDVLEITVTGISGETWRWYFLVEGGEIAYGT